MPSPTLIRDVSTALALVRREAIEREAGRAAELRLGGGEAAALHFRRASGLRRLRLALLERCELL